MGIQRGFGCEFMMALLELQLKIVAILLEQLPMCDHWFLLLLHLSIHKTIFEVKQYQKGEYWSELEIFYYHLKRFFSSGFVWSFIGLLKILKVIILNFFGDVYNVLL